MCCPYWMVERRTINSTGSAISGRRLQPQVAQPGVIIRPSPEWPAEPALGLRDYHVVDAGVPLAHESELVELPVLVAVGTEPVVGIVVPLVREAHGDARALEGPDFLDEPVVELARPL